MSRFIADPSFGVTQTSHDMLIGPCCCGAWHQKCLERDDCTDTACVGHCPRCQSNQIGGGGCNGMFCVACGHFWDGPNDETSS